MKKCKINDHCCVYHECMGGENCQKDEVLSQGHPGWGEGRCEKFLHDHPVLEQKLGIDKNHVIVDRKDWEKIKQLIIK